MRECRGAGARFLYWLCEPAGLLERPVFIVGCGRSGTTILGQLLGEHTKLAYLHEARPIWTYEPRTDIWSFMAARRGGRLVLTDKDARPDLAARMAHAFSFEVERMKAVYLVEKLPINAFRVPFIAALFPEARFIHVVRNGLEVADSIAERARVGSWYGYQDYKWKQLAAHAEARGEDELVPLCDDGFHRGLLEWRLSVEAARSSLANLPSDRVLELRYETLVGESDKVCDQLAAFIGVEPSPEMYEFAAKEIAGREGAGEDAAGKPDTEKETAGTEQESVGRPRTEKGEAARVVDNAARRIACDLMGRLDYPLPQA